MVTPADPLPSPTTPAQAGAGLPTPPEPARDPAQESLVSALRSSFTILRLVMLVLVVLYLVSGVFRIEPGDQGIIVRLGRLKLNHDKSSEHYGTPIHDQGWVWTAWPDPFDQKIRLPATIHSLETDAFLFRRDQADIENRTELSAIRARGDTLKPGVDGTLLTGDKNLSHGLWTVQYRIANAADFVRNVGDRRAEVEPLLVRLLESAILREVAHRKVEEVTRTKRDIIADAVRKRLQRELDHLAVGVEAVKVTANTIVPPQVAPAFDAVTRAENERRQQEDAARQRATEILNQTAGPQHRELLERIQRYGAAQLTEQSEERLEQLRQEIDEALSRAQGEVAARLRAAEAEANSVREAISREYQEFTYWLAQYQAYPRQTLLKLWTRVQDEVLTSRQNEVFWVPDTDVIEILVNRDPQRAVERERERLQRQIEESR